MPSNYNATSLQKKVIFFIVLATLLLLSLTTIFIGRNSHYITLSPQETPTKAIIFYPGVFLSPEAYITRFSSLVKHSATEVFLMRSSYSLSVISGDPLKTIIKQHPSIHTWFIAGHSLGGNTACQEVVANPGLFQELILIASHCGKEIAQYQGKIVVILGSEDPFETKNRVLPTLPKNAEIVSIQGANHSIFAETVPFPFDHPAIITKEQFIRQFTSLLLRVTQ